MGPPDVESPLPAFVVQRYVTPLREGGSLPALVDVGDAQRPLWVLKFRGAGQGAPALVAEVLTGELARAVGLRVPALAALELPAAIGRAEPDPEIRELLLASVGTNLGMEFLTGALSFDAAAAGRVDPALAARIVLFDAFSLNVDRTARNPNLLSWRGELWLIDHGASLYFQHDWAGGAEGVARPFPRVRDHVLLPFAADLGGAAASLAEALTPASIAAAAAKVPDAWLVLPETLESAAARREAYVRFLAGRVGALPALAEEAERARALLV